MGSISFQQATESMNSYGGDSASVGFFTLKNDGDEAIVRIMHDNTDSFDIMAVHPVTIEGKHRKVNCLRDPREPLDKCPLCASGVKIENRFFIHLIQYDKDQNGNIIPSAKVWERSISYANQLATFINEYGPLSDCIFKIKRCGAAGSMDTTYQIMYASPQVYRPDIYIKRTDLFDNFKVLGYMVMDKSYEELSTFVATGEFPQKQQSSSNVTPGAYNNTVNDNYDPRLGHAPYESSNSRIEYDTITNPVEYNSPAPWESNTPSQINRPIRTY